MAVYKVIQDVEAEDKLLGPLTLKALAYAGIAATLAFINFRLLISTIGPIKYLLILILLFPMLLFGVLASPLGREQPTEVWLLSRVRFMLKPRKRIWNQSGISHVVTVTVPKKEERPLTKDLSQTEVKSRLKALADTIDSRGWAVKNANLNEAVTPAVAGDSKNDRLVKIDSIPKEMPTVEVHPKDDILDEKHNPTAKKFDHMMKEAAGKRKRSLLDMVKSAIIEPDKDQHHEAKEKTERDVITTAVEPRAHKQQHLKKSPHKTKQTTHTVATITANSATKAPNSSTGSTAAQKRTATASTKPSPTPVTPAAQAVNMKLAQSGSDLKVSTVAQMADHLAKVRQIGPNEVEIDLH